MGSHQQFQLYSQQTTPLLINLHLLFPTDVLLAVYGLHSSLIFSISLCVDLTGGDRTNHVWPGV